MDLSGSDNFTDAAVLGMHQAAVLATAAVVCLQVPAAVLGRQAAARCGHLSGTWHGLPALTQPSHPSFGEERCCLPHAMMHIGSRGV
jgi:hypothetical protein